MPGIVTVSDEICKGCELCAAVCPQKIIVLDLSKLNARGYNPAACADPEKCIACGMCAIMCPDSAIKVERE